MEANNREIIFKSLFFNKVTTANEKIRMIKDAFTLSLKDLAGEDISTMCISNIINGKQGITEFSGACLIKNINLLLKINIEIGWLLEEPSKQADKLLEINIDNYIKGEVSIDFLEKIVGDNTSYATTGLLLQSYEVLSEGYKVICRKKSLSYIDKGIEISFKVSNFEKEIRFKKLRGDIEFNQGNIEDALRLYESIKDRAIDNMMKFKIHYNIIICLGRLKKYREMLDEIEVFEKTYKISEEDKRDLEMMKANNFSVLKEYEKALRIYEMLLFESIKLNNAKYIGRLHFNIADIYFEKGDLELAKKYIDLSLEQENDLYIVKHLLFAATINNDLKYVQRAKEKVGIDNWTLECSIYNKELEMLINNNNSEMLKVVLDTCIDKNIKLSNQVTLTIFMLNNFEKEEVEKYLKLFEKNKCF